MRNFRYLIIFRIYKNAYYHHKFEECHVNLGYVKSSSVQYVPTLNDKKIKLLAITNLQDTNEVFALLSLGY